MIILKALRKIRFLASHAFYSKIKLMNEKRDVLTPEENMIILMIVEGQMAALRGLIEGKLKLKGKNSER